MSITIGKERNKTFVEMDVEMDDATHSMLVEYALKHIVEDKPSLVNYAFNRILAEQVKMKDNPLARKPVAKKGSRSKKG